LCYLGIGCVLAWACPVKRLDLFGPQGFDATVYDPAQSLPQPHGLMQPTPFFEEKLVLGEDLDMDGGRGKFEFLAHD
jgi:hypothetical protein